MNYFKIHDVNPEELRDKFMQSLKDANMSPFSVAKQMDINHASIAKFLATPSIVRYRTAAAIINWLQKIEEKGNEMRLDKYL